MGITSRVAVCVLLLAAESTQGKHHSCLVEPPFPQLKAHFWLSLSYIMIGHDSYAYTGFLNVCVCTLKIERLTEQVLRPVFRWIYTHQ